MPRSPARTATRRKPEWRAPELVATRILDRLIEENRVLSRELGELRQLRRLALQDPLTGLHNRRFLEERLEEELSRARRARDRRGALLVADVNDLKVVNDHFGHAMGDEALRAVGAALRGALRAADVCCRTGGDEFMMLLPDTDARGARLTMARLRGLVMRIGARRDLPLSISLGAACWPADGLSAATLVGRADRAMYREKRRSRDAKPGPRSGHGGRTLALVK